ncbi:very short patch repair endonuclease [Aquabacterium sp. NJ1]|uniref:very short patch repair endonuclease n=1 Tax=Aquabacterium sp. NJ1 TaxID=1538295 RepID=UPI0009DF69B9|nr:DNA mismatch endonuclease Vsr [Aquabacterium sp. NJ1]
MADIVPPTVRSRMMSGIRGGDTKPELMVRKCLFASGYRFRLHRKDLPGCPDVVLTGRRIAVFVHGCFWHQHLGCKYAKLPGTRVDFWRGKLSANVVRDRHAIELLGVLGWRVLVIWECATRTKVGRDALPEKLREWIEGSTLYGEISLQTTP